MIKRKRKQRSRDNVGGGRGPVIPAGTVMPEREKPLIGWQRQRRATDDHEDDEMMKWFQPQKLGTKRPPAPYDAPEPTPHG